MNTLPKPPLHPSLYQINTRVWLTALARELGRPATLDDVPDAELDAVAALGFDWLWLLSVWRTGAAGQRVSRANRKWRSEFEETLADLCDEDIGGSGFAITGCTISPRLGGDAALQRFRKRLRDRGIRLMVDFVPNHTALDHPWVEEHPEYYVRATETDLARAPQNYVSVTRAGGDLFLAHGRDPYFDGWADTLQLNYANTAVQDAMVAELLSVARQCDGVRCDMAMLILPEVFERTWGFKPAPFWPNAIQRVRSDWPDFVFLAEVYWDLEWTLMQQGFDYAYDKRLYDRLRDGHAAPVREHLYAAPDYQTRLARFLENHDEPRAAAIFPREVHEAAAIVTYLSPGLRFFHQGQLQGKTKRISAHLVRAPEELRDEKLEAFYERLLRVIRRAALRDGRWRLLECAPAWDGNPTADAFIAWTWEGPGGERLLVTVNYAPHQSQCYVRLPFTDLGGAAWQLEDLLGGARYERDGGDLQSRGLYLDVPPWHCHVFTMKAA